MDKQSFQSLQGLHTDGPEAHSASYRENSTLFGSLDGSFTHPDSDIEVNEQFGSEETNNSGQDGISEFADSEMSDETQEGSDDDSSNDFNDISPEAKNAYETAKLIGLEFYASGRLRANKQFLFLSNSQKVSIYGPYPSSRKSPELLELDLCLSIYHSAARLAGFSFAKTGTASLDVTALPLIQRFENTESRHHIRCGIILSIKESCNKLRELMERYFESTLGSQLDHVLEKYFLGDIRQEVARNISMEYEENIYAEASDTFAANQKDCVRVSKLITAILRQI